MNDDHTTHYYRSHDGLRLFYRDYASGRPGVPVLCLPGLTRNSRDFEDLAPHLARRRRVIAPDLRGHGFSAWDPNWKNYHPGTFLMDVSTLLDKLGLGEVIVIGTSLGGLIAMAMAWQDQARLAGAIMNDIGPEIAPEGLARIAGDIGNPVAVHDWGEAAAQTREAHSQALPDLDEDDWRKLARRSYRAGADGVPVPDVDPDIGAAIRAVGPDLNAPWQMFDALAETPTLVLRGELSDILAAETLARMHAHKPDLQSVEVPNRGHVPLLEEPECLAAIDRFLLTLPGRKRIGSPSSP